MKRIRKIALYKRIFYDSDEEKYRLVIEVLCSKKEGYRLQNRLMDEL